MSGRKLNANTFVVDDEGVVVHLSAGTVPPKDLLPKLGEHLFVTDGGDDDTEAAPAGPQRPAGNASAAKWTSYAEDLGIEVPEDVTKRDDIVALVDAHESQD